MKRVSDRLAGLAVTILLQAAFIALFLQTPHLGPAPKELARELIFILPRLQLAPKKMAAPRAVPPPLIEAPSAPPVVSPPPAAAPPDAANLEGLGRSLFGCTLNNLGNLSPEERIRCGAVVAPPDEMAVIAPPSHVKDPTRREAELAARNTPGRVPCVGLLIRDLGPGKTDIIPGADPVCIINGLISGFRVTGLPP